MYISSYFSNCQNQLDHRKSKRIPENICFIDYAKAFDCVDHSKLWKILKEMRIPDHLTCLLRNLYVGQEATVRTRHGTMDKFQIEKGSILSPYLLNLYAEFSSVQFSHSVVSNSLWPHGLQHARPPCPSTTPRVFSNSCLLSQWCHPTIPSSVIPFSSRLQLFPASGSFIYLFIFNFILFNFTILYWFGGWLRGSFNLNQLFISGGQNIRVSASTSVLPMNTQDWSPLGWTGWISLQSKGLSRVFYNTTVQKHQFFGIQLSL